MIISVFVEYVYLKFDYRGIVNILKNVYVMGISK